MSRKSSGLICLCASVLFALQASLSPAFAAEGARGGEPIGASRDGGEPVSGKAPAKKSSEIWGWVAGAAVVVAGFVIGYILADKSNDNKDDAADAAKDAQASADAANASADAAAAGDAGQYEYTMYITGTFRASAPITWHGMTFTPSVTFATKTTTYGGGISDYTSSSTDASSGRGGEFEQTGYASMWMMVDDGWYQGEWTANTSSGESIQNQLFKVTLYAVGSAKIYFRPNKQQ